MNISDKLYKENIDELKNTVLTGKTASIQWRIKQIKLVSKLLDKHTRDNKMSF